MKNRFYEANYTMLVGEVCQNLALQEKIKFDNKLSNEEIIEIARKKIFDFNYTFYDDDVKRSAFERNILHHFFFDEIGQETYEKWKWFLRDWMITNMPRYYSLFKTIPFQDQDDPTSNTRYTEKYIRKNKASAVSGGEDVAETTTSSTPQGRLTLEGVNGRWIDNIARSTTKPGTTSDSDATEEYEFERRGNIGIQTMAEVLEGSRSAIITIENQLYTEMEDYGLFFGLLV